MSEPVKPALSAIQEADVSASVTRYAQTHGVSEVEARRAFEDRLSHEVARHHAGIQSLEWATRVAVVGFRGTSFLPPRTEAP